VKTKTTAKKRRYRGRGDKTIAKLIEQRGSVAQFARDLSRLCGRKVTWGCVNNWKIRNSVSKNMVIYVHRLTGVPFNDLLR
jgi:hypothetical protein